MTRDAQTLAEMRAEFMASLAIYAKARGAGYEQAAVDLDALLAAARAEALEEAAQPMEDDGMARHEDDEVRRVLARHVRRIRALVKP